MNEMHILHPDAPLTKALTVGMGYFVVAAIVVAILMVAVDLLKKCSK